MSLIYTVKKSVSRLKRIKINYHGNLDENNIADNKLSWKTVKPLLSDKSVYSDKIHLNENEELINSEYKTAEALNEFFSNIVKILNIPEYENLNPNLENVKETVLKTILKYKNHPSITAIQKIKKLEI